MDGSRFDPDLLVGLLDVIVSFLSIFSFSENWRLLFEEKRRNILIFAVNLDVEIVITVIIYSRYVEDCGVLCEWRMQQAGNNIETSK